MGIYSIIMDSNEKSHGSSHDGVTARDSLYSCIENGDTEHIENEFQNFRRYFLDFIRRDMSSYQLTINYLLAQLEIVAERGGVSLQQCCNLQENYYQRIKEAGT